MNCPGGNLVCPLGVLGACRVVASVGRSPLEVRWVAFDTLIMRESVRGQALQA